MGFLHIGRKLPQPPVQDAVHGPGVAGLVSLRHGGLRAETIFLDQGDKHIPLAPIPDGRLQQPAQDLTVHGRINFLQDRFHEEIHFFQLVIEGDIVLGELKFVNVILLCHHFPQHIQGRENPAPAGLHLVGNRHGLDVDGEHVRAGRRSLQHPGNRSDVIGCQSIADNPGLFILKICFLHPVQVCR